MHLLRRAGHGRDAQTAGVDGRGAGVLDGNPLLNPATLVFMGFVLGWQFALVRTVAGLATVLTVATLVQKWVKEAATRPVAVPAAPSEATQGGFFSRWLQALWTLFWNTIGLYPRGAGAGSGARLAVPARRWRGG